jgi:hypothetical protein
MGRPPSFNGIPIAPDVQRLIAAYKLTPGALIDYDAIADTIKSPAQSSRWRTVVGAWRRTVMHADNVVLKARPDKRAYEVLHGDGRIIEAMSARRAGVRRIKLSQRIVVGTGDDTLSPEFLDRKQRLLANDATLLLHERMAGRRFQPKLTG